MGHQVQYAPDAPNPAVLIRAAPTGAIETQQLRSTPGLIARPESVGISLEPASGATFAEFKCEDQTGSIEGSVIAPITPISKMRQRVIQTRVRPRQEGGGAVRMS